MPRVGDCGNTVVSVRTVPTLRVVHYPQFPSCMYEGRRSSAHVPVHVDMVRPVL